MRFIRPVFVSLVAALALSSCGGGDEAAAVDEPTTVDTAAVDTAVDDTTSDTATDESVVDEPADVVEGPVSTLSPDIPEEVLEGLGPVDVSGDPLPPFDDKVADDSAVGATVPTLVGLDLDGDPIRIDPATDGPAMIVFVAHWCSHCNAEVPRLNELRDEGRFPDGLDIVAVATGSRPDYPNWPPGEWLTDTMGWTYPAMLDGIDLERGTYIAGAAYGISGFPFVVLVDGDGTVVERWSGERDPDEIIAAIESGLGLG